MIIMTYALTITPIVISHWNDEERASDLLIDSLKEKITKTEKEKMSSQK